MSKTHRLIINKPGQLTWGTWGGNTAGQVSGLSNLETEMSITLMLDKSQKYIEAQFEDWR